MEALRAMLATLMLMLLLSAPTLAGGGTGGDTVTKTFALHLSGDIPDDQLFAGFVFTREAIESGTGLFTVILFCGDLPDEVINETEQDPTIEFIVVSSDPCEGGEGTEYNTEVDLERGSEIAFGIFRSSLEDGNDFEIIAETAVDETGNPAEYETINEDTTNSIMCSFENGTCGGDVQASAAGVMPAMVSEDVMAMMDVDEETPSMPNTGAGAMAGAGVPVGNAAAALSLATWRGGLRRPEGR